MKKITPLIIPPWTGAQFQKLNFSDDPTEQIQLDRMLFKINELVEMNNEMSVTLAQFYEYVKQELEGFAGSILNKWLEDGTLAEIINVTIFGELNDKVNTNTANITNIQNTLNALVSEVSNHPYGKLDSALCVRQFFNYIPDVTSESELSPAWGYSQGMTTTDNTVIFAVLPAGTYASTSNLTKLIEIEKGTSNVLREVVLTLYHANALAFNKRDNEIYVACNSTVINGSTVPNNNIIVLDYDTFNIKRTVVPPSEITATNRVRSVSYDNSNNTLMLGDETTCFFMENFETVKSKLELNMTGTLARTSTTNIQTIKHYAEYIYLVRMNPSGIVVFTKEGNVKRNYYDLSECDFICTGEMEDVSIESNGDIYFSTCQTCRYNSLIFTFDYTTFKSNIFNGGYRSFLGSTQKNNHIQTYVHNTSKALQMGVGSSNPFGTPNQALFLSPSILGKSGIRINCQIYGDYGWFGGSTPYQVYLDGNGFMNLHALLNRGSNFIIDQVNVIATPFCNLNTSTNPANVFFFDNSKTTIINGCVFDSSTTKQQNGILIANSELSLESSTIKNFLNGIRLQSAAKVHLNNTTLTANDNYYYCTVRYCELFDNTNQTWNNCNKAGSLPDVTSMVQRIDFTQSGQNITFANKSAVIYKEKIYTFRYQYQSTTPHYFQVTSKGECNSANIYANDTIISTFAIKINDDNEGNVNFTWKWKQFNYTTNTTSELSTGVTVEVTDITVIN